MPRRDGTGPMGRGATSGGGLGICNRANAFRFGTGLRQGCKRGFERNFEADSIVSKTKKELLLEQKEMLESKLDIISNRLQSL